MEQRYTALGHLAEVADPLSGTIYWEALEVNAEGQVEEEILGNGVTTQRLYSPENGLVERIDSAYGLDPIQALSFQFDLVGNFTQRVDELKNRQEDFLYDGLNRLLSADLTDTVTGGQLALTTYAYDSIGNITEKSDVGLYSYGQGAGPNAVTSAGGNTYNYDANGAMTGGAGRSMTWTSFNKPATLTQGVTAVNFQYAQRRRAAEWSTAP